MKSFCKTLVLGLVIVVMTMMPIGKAYCQSAPEPAVVISIADLKEQLNDVNYVLTASGFAQMKFMASAMINGYTKGLDSEKDAGVLLFFAEDAEEPDFLAFVPVKNIEEMLDVVAGMAEVEEDDDFTTIVTDQGIELLVKERDGYAFISNKKEMLENLPDEPTKMLGDLPTKYNLSARVYGQRIPEALRNQALELIRESSQQTLDNLDNDVQAELQEKNLELQMKQMEMVFNESDTLTIGMTADKDSKNLVMEMEFTGVPNSELATKLASGAPKQPSRFTGFLIDGATFTQNQNFSVSDEDAKEYSRMLDDLKKTAVNELDQDGDLSENEMKSVESALSNMIDVLKATLAEGILDSGAVVMLEDGEINFAAGAHVANPKKVEATVKDLAALAEEKMGDEIEVNLNSGSHKDITFHRFVVQVPDEEEEMRDALGDQVTLVVGIGEKAVYLGAGSNPVATLKKAVDGTDAAGSKVRSFIRSMPIFELVDKNNDSAFSKKEIEKTPAALTSLDKNENGEISMAEMMPEEQASELRNVVDMRSLPIVKAIDKDKNNVFSKSEIKGSEAAMLSLDINKDGNISIKEMMPDADMMQYNLYVTPILKFVAGMEGDPSVEAMAKALEESGNDRVRVTSNLIKNGATMRFEMQDGILGLIKVGFDAFSQGGGGGFPGGDDDF